jgi:glycosyltransferase involved in cell wall biosynthesis
MFVAAAPARARASGPFLRAHRDVSDPRVAVIIPTHQRLSMLQEAVASVRAQTLPPEQLELIVVDDGSDDGTWAWLEAQADLQALRHEQRRGPSAARNTGAAASRSELLAFLDSDDLFRPDKLARQLELLDAAPDLGLCHSDETWLRHGKELRQLPKHEKRGGWIFEHCLPMCRISPSAAVIRRPLFEALGGFDEALEVAEDYELWLRLTCRHEVGFIAAPLTIKRGGHADQLSAKYGQIEKFRIEALRRVLGCGALSPKQRAAALMTLRDKCEVHARGCDKRGKAEEAARYRALGRGG